MIGLPPTLNRGLGTSKDKGLNRVPVQRGRQDNETIDQIDTSTLESSLVPPPRN